MFLAESTRAVLEIKTRWNSEELDNILEKCRSIRDIVLLKQPNLADDIAMLQLEVASLAHGVEHSGMIIAGHHIATGAVVLFGGQAFSATSLNEQIVLDADDAWPDILLLLEQGKIVLKRYVRDDRGWGGEGWLEFVEAGEDALLVFTAALLGLITERSVHVEDPFYLAHYTGSIMQELQSTTLPFPITRPVAGRTPLWHDQFQFGGYRDS